MKRVLGAAFLLLYAASAVLAIAEHTTAWASTLRLASKAPVTEIRATSTRLSQVRVEEDPFVLVRTPAAFALSDIGANEYRPESIRYIFDSNRSELPRAPPGLL